jgi:UBX domain-containing protein 1
VLDPEADPSARPSDREYILQTTFPPRELPDAETVEQAKLQNAVVIQRFTTCTSHRASR